MVKHKHTTHAPDELRQASTHVFYELQMLLGTAERSAGLAPDADQVLRCALLESFLIHARALHHFLWPSGTIHASDVLARDYFDKRAWTPPDGGDGPELSDLRAPVGTYVAHISYGRPKQGSEKVWPFGRIATELDRCMRQFQADVERETPSLLSDEWKVSGKRVAFFGACDNLSTTSSAPLDVHVSTDGLSWKWPIPK